MDPREIEIVRKWHRPLEIGQLWFVLGLCYYFQKFVHGYFTLVATLTSLTWSKTKFIWIKDCESAFENVTLSLTHAPCLTLLKLGEPFEVINDSFRIGARAIMLQEGRPLAFESRKFFFGRRNYSTREQELVAVVLAMQTWQCYLEGVNYTVVIDHNPLEYLKTQQNFKLFDWKSWSIFLSLLYVRLEDSNFN